MPGDTIYLDNYLLYIKPKNENHFLTEFELTQTKYDITVANAPVQWDKDLGAKGKMQEIVLGEDEYFVLCDNRLESSDSRTWGVVRQSTFKGKVLLVYFHSISSAFSNEKQFYFPLHSRSLLQKEM